MTFLVSFTNIGILTWFIRPKGRSKQVSYTTKETTQNGIGRKRKRTESHLFMLLLEIERNRTNTKETIRLVMKRKQKGKSQLLLRVCEKAKNDVATPLCGCKPASVV